MPKNSTTTSQIHALFARAMSTPVAINLPSHKAATTLRHRLYSARKALRTAGRASQANLVELVIRDAPSALRAKNPDACVLLARPIDYDFDEAIAEALGGVPAKPIKPLTAEEPTPSIEDILGDSKP